MTDKQIIIDYENLCENYSKVVGCYITFDGSCIKEQCFTYRLLQLLKAKEQEFEELKKNVEHWKMEHKEAKAKGEWTYDLVKKRLEQQLDKLKAENEKYSFFIEKLCDYAGLECDDEEQAMRTLSDLASQMDKVKWVIYRYKQTLTEIKEIAEDFYLDGEHVKDKYLAQEIIQKISECEVNK